MDEHRPIGRAAPPSNSGWTGSSPPAPDERFSRRPLPFDNIDAPLYSVGQVAGMLDVQPAFLRRLDSEAVVQPSRSDGGQRRYSQQQILLVERVTEFAEAGMNLAGIRHILELEARVHELERALEAERRRPEANHLRDSGDFIKVTDVKTPPKRF